MKNRVFIFLLFFSFAAVVSAQMPVPLLAPVSSNSFNAANQTEARQKLEALLSCQGVKSLDAKAVESQFLAIGLVKGVDGFYLPAAGAELPVLFGDQVMAGLVSSGQEEVKATVYLMKQTGKQLAKKLGVTQVNEHANTDEPSYFKKNGKKATLLVGSASEVFLGNGSIRYQSAVACQIAK